MGAGGCLFAVAQWESTGCTSQEPWVQFPMTADFSLFLLPQKYRPVVGHSKCNTCEWVVLYSPCCSICKQEWSTDQIYCYSVDTETGYQSSYTLPLPSISSLSSLSQKAAATDFSLSMLQWSCNCAQCYQHNLYVTHGWTYYSKHGPISLDWL